MQLIAYKSQIENNKILIEDSQKCGVRGELKDALEYLTAATEGFNVVWDIDAFVAPLLHKMTPEHTEALYHKGKVNIDGYTVIYNQAKSLCVKYGGRSASYYWLEQYYKDEPEPDFAGIIKCAEDMLTDLKKLGVFPTKLTSSVAIFDCVFDQLNLPTYLDLPDELCQWTWAQKSRAWTEAFKLGHFPMCTDLDINSCFPSVMAKLYDTRYGDWYKGLDIPSNAKYVIYKGELNTDAYISPFIHANRYGHLYSPKGKREAILSQDEVNYLNDYKGGCFRPTDAYYWIPNKLYTPLNYTVNKLFGYRKKGFSRGTKRAIKGALVGIYGRFYQEFKNGKLGKNVNPLWGFLIESNARLKIARFIKDNGLDDRVLSINTDGVLLEGDYQMESSNQIGQWRVDGKGSALIVSSGLVFFGEKRPCQTNYDEALELIRANPTAQKWTKSAKRMITIGDAVTGWKEELGTYQETSPGFGVVFDHDREYKALPQTGQELLDNVYHSEPIDIEVLA